MFPLLAHGEQRKYSFLFFWRDSDPAHRRTREHLRIVDQFHVQLFRVKGLGTILIFDEDRNRCVCGYHLETPVGTLSILF